MEEAFPNRHHAEAGELGSPVEEFDSERLRIEPRAVSTLPHTALKQGSSNYPGACFIFVFVLELAGHCNPRDPEVPRGPHASQSHAVVRPASFIRRPQEGFWVLADAPLPLVGLFWL